MLFDLTVCVVVSVIVYRLFNKTRKIDRGTQTKWPITAYWSPQTPIDMELVAVEDLRGKPEKYNNKNYLKGGRRTVRKGEIK